MEPSFYGDVAIIKAYKADTKGNLIFNKTAKNMNKDFATAASIVIVEVIVKEETSLIKKKKTEEIVEAGEIDPNDVHLPGVFVTKVVKGPKYERRIYTTPKRKVSAESSAGNLFFYLFKKKLNFYIKVKTKLKCKEKKSQKELVKKSKTACISI